MKQGLPKTWVNMNMQKYRGWKKPHCRVLTIFWQHFGLTLIRADAVFSDFRKFQRISKPLMFWIFVDRFQWTLSCFLCIVWRGLELLSQSRLLTTAVFTLRDTQNLLSDYSKLPPHSTLVSVELFNDMNVKFAFFIPH